MCFSKRIWVGWAMVGCLCLWTAESRAQNYSNRDDSAGMGMTMPLPPEYDPAINCRIQQQYARYQLLSEKYGSFQFYLYHFYGQRADVGRRRLLVGAVIASVAVALAVPGVIMAPQPNDSTAETGDDLLILSLYAGVAALPFLIAGGIKYGRNKGRMERLAPYVRNHHSKSIGFGGIGAMVSRGGGGVQASLAF
ncbi:MAG: hypothetical protein JXX14_01200 [Deltaproteobacteria bacterium]|nr:hypothetical protein [Deltaproteobacteria bacterium]